MLPYAELLSAGCCYRSANEPSVVLCSIWSAIIQCKQLVKLELSMPYEKCDGDYDYYFINFLDQDCLLDLPPSLSVALLSIPLKSKMDFDTMSWSVASLEGFSPQHLQSLVLTTGILWNNNAKVSLSHRGELADPAIQCIFHKVISDSSADIQ